MSVFTFHLHLPLLQVYFGDESFMMIHLHRNFNLSSNFLKAHQHPVTHG